MKLLLIDYDCEQAAAKLRGRFPRASHVRQTIDTDTKVIAPNGKIIAILLCAVVPKELYEPAHKLWRRVKGLPTNRATAMGTRSLPRSVNRHGEPSPQSGVNVRVLDVIKARQGILGWDDRRGGQTKLTIEHPEMLGENKPLIKLVDRLYKLHMPNLYAIQKAQVKKNPSCRLWHTSFSSIYILKSGRTAYHRDSNNLRSVMTAIMPLGRFKGAELALPRWRISFAYKPGDLLLFDPQQLHGNLPFEGERLSAAFYCARHVADCSRS